MDWVTAISAASKSLELLKQLRDIDTDIDKATFKLKVADLSSVLADTKLALVEAKAEAEGLQDQINNLKSTLKFKAESTIEQNGLLYWKREDGMVDEMPFCPNCVADGVFIKVIRELNTTLAKCPRCKSEFASRSINYSPGGQGLRQRPA